MSVRGRSRWAGSAPAAYSLALALLVLGPLLGPGYLLLRDAVSTPRSYLTDSALGLGDAAPRAVPQDALLATLSPVIDGGLLVKAILLAALWLAGWGAAALTRTLLNASTAPQLVAATITIWNPYVAERLLQGHWSLLTGYAALPWIALLATRLRATSTASTPESAANSPRATATAGASTGGQPAVTTEHTTTRLRTWSIWAGLGGWLAAAGLTPTGSLLAGCVALLLVGRRNLLGTVGLWIAASAPWLAATILAGSGAEPSDPAGVAAFAARAEPFLGTLGSLAGLGGIWNSTAVPDSRTTFFAAIGTAVLLALVATGVRSVIGHATRLRAHADSVRGESGGGAAGLPGAEISASAGEVSLNAAVLHVRRVLVALAAVAVVVPALGATGWGLSVGEFLVTKVPGAGLLRDTQKFVALAVPAFALCAAAGCEVVAEWAAAWRGRIGSQSMVGGVDADGDAGDQPGARRHRARGEGARERVRVGGVAAVFIVLVLVSLPDMAWGVGGALRPVHYPGGWERVASLVEGPGDVAVLPGGMFRKFRFAGAAPVLDPAPRMLARDVLQTGELPVPGATVSGEGARARTVEQLLLHGGSAAELAKLGVGWVLVESGTPGPMGESKTTLGQLNSVYADRDLRLYRVPGDIAEHDASAAARRASGAAHLLWAALLCGGIVSAAARLRARASGNGRYGDEAGNSVSARHR